MKKILWLILLISNSSHSLEITAKLSAEIIESIDSAIVIYTIQGEATGIRTSVNVNPRQQLAVESIEANTCGGTAILINRGFRLENGVSSDVCSFALNLQPSAPGIFDIGATITTANGRSASTGPVVLQSIGMFDSPPPPGPTAVPTFGLFHILGLMAIMCLVGISHEINKKQNNA